jgi:hypothetical protein
VHELSQHTAEPADCEQLVSLAQMAPSGCVPLAPVPAVPAELVVPAELIVPPELVVPPGLVVPPVPLSPPELMERPLVEPAEPEVPPLAALPPVVPPEAGEPAPPLGVLFESE